MTRRERRATYRLQLTPAFGFDRAAELVEPLRRLGVSHLYLSPIAQAVPSSLHGYDVVDHRVVRNEFGGSAGLGRLLDGAVDAGLGVIVDHVPNHVSIERPHLNPNWWATLRDGPESRAAEWFDVDWEIGGGRVLVPRLGDPAELLLERGELTVADVGDGREVRYGPLRFPVRPGTEHLSLPELIEAQHYRLTWWRSPERNMRRFFTIDDLAAVRVEVDHVRSDVDAIPTALRDHPAFDGVRIDHVDGLADPTGYLEHLRSLLGERWILVEKILGPGERLPVVWPVDGTTGYEFVVAAEHVMAHASTRAVFDGFRRRLGPAGAAETYHAVEDRARREVLDEGLRPDLDRLLRAVGSDTVAAGTGELHEAVVELTVSLDRYRTYLPSDPASTTLFEQLVGSVRSVHPGLADAVDRFGALVRDDDQVRTRWQQLTGPAMAKGAEDRAFFRYQLLAGWNEVGGRPDVWEISADDFHRAQEAMLTLAPANLLVSTTHDTKRSSGVRARSIALSALAETFVSAADAWVAEHAAVCAPLRSNDLSLALQTAVTAWPIDSGRLREFLVKSAREADTATSWTEPDDAYERALRTISERLCHTLEDDGRGLGAVARECAALGRDIGDALAVLHATCPGVPDFYQGMPFELLTLVDPDNRTEPDWERWRETIERAAGDDHGADLLDVERARLTMRLLDLRRRRPGCFGETSRYERLSVSGTGGERTVAFRRASGSDVDQVVVVVAPLGVEPGDVELELPTGHWRSVVDPGRASIGGGVCGVERLLGARRAVVLEPAG